MMSTTGRRRLTRGTALTAAGVLTTGLALTAVGGGQAQAAPAQPVLGARSAAIITVDGLRFKDLDGSGDLTPYEDWRLTPQERASDLLARMSLAEKAGLLVHGTLATTGTAYNVATNTDLIDTRKMNTFITRLSTTPTAMATQSNVIQEIAEGSGLGIPVVISTDPRNGFAVTEGQTVARVGTTAFPDAIGMAAADDPALTQQYGDVIRREYRALGLHEGLSPQADIATEPRWTRINGTFGSDPQKAKAQVNAYITGMQNGATGLGKDSVAAVVKHWVGYGAQVNGYDSHYYYGRFASFTGGNFAQHVIPYEGAFAAKAAGVMPTYSILKDLVYKGQNVEQVGAGFNKFLLTDVLRGDYGFDGVMVSDFGIFGDCPQVCQDNRPPASFIGSWGVGMPWGVESLSVEQRYAKAITAGVDQIGGSNEPAQVVAAVNDGLITTSRLNDASRRVLIQKFQLGLFENPYVDAATAGNVAGSAANKVIGDAAQARSLTLLTNKADTLPAKSASVKKVYLYGVGAAAAQARGLTVVDTPAAADLAIVRLADPRGGADLTDLDFKGTEADYAAFAAAAATSTPTIAVPKLDRPLVLTNVADRAEAVLANYGVTDAVLLDTIFGDRAPGGELPFELASSMADVAKQQGDVPNDTANQLFKAGTGLSYAVKSVTAPSVTGKAKVGKTLRASTGTWTPAPTSYTYQWTRDGKAIKGATSSTYRVRKADVRDRLAVTVTASKAQYAGGTASSPATRTVPRLATRTSLVALKRGAGKVTLRVRVVAPKSGGAKVNGKVVLRDGADRLRVVKVRKGRVTVTVRLSGGTHRLTARYLRSKTAQDSSSDPVVVRLG